MKIPLESHLTQSFPLKSHLPSGKHTKNYGKSPFLTGKLAISMAINNSYLKLPEDMCD
jgi:hypothetical protein